MALTTLNLTGGQVEHVTAVDRIAAQIRWFIYDSDIQTTELGCWAISLIWIYLLLKHPHLFEVNPTFSTLRATVSETAVLACAAVAAIPPVVGFILTAIERADAARLWRRSALGIYVFLFAATARAFYMPTEASGVKNALFTLFALGASWGFWRLRPRRR